MHGCVFCGEPCDCGEQSTYFCDSCSACYDKGIISEFDDSDDDYYDDSDRRYDDDLAAGDIDWD